MAPKKANDEDRSFSDHPSKVATNSEPLESTDPSSSTPSSSLPQTVSPKKSRSKKKTSDDTVIIY